MRKRKKNYYKVRSLRISDETFKKLKRIKKRGESWDLFLKKLLYVAFKKNKRSN